MDFESTLIGDSTKEPVCNGKVYKCKLTTSIGNRGEYVETMKMVPMKKLSCPGCESCGLADDDLRDVVSYDDRPTITNPENGALYVLTIVNESRENKRTSKRTKRS